MVGQTLYFKIIDIFHIYMAFNHVYPDAAIKNFDEIKITQKLLRMTAVLIQNAT